MKATFRASVTKASGYTMYLYLLIDHNYAGTKYS